jgi:hypothetical protein
VAYGTAGPTLDSPPAFQLPVPAPASVAPAAAADTGPRITFPAFSNLQTDTHRGL